MQLKTSVRPNVIILEITGRFDLEQGTAFQNTLKEILTGKPPQMAIDLEKVDYMDSSGIAELIKALNAVEGYGGKLMMVSIQPDILKTLTASRLDNYFKIMTKAEFDGQYPA
ncbi:MAG: STAS domain-containing protein [Spirochaetia bacterium]|nr:STAS domain-containing protein [Spirochaetia bacterium]